MARSPRRLFAAPFVLTAAIATPAHADDPAGKIRFDGYQCLQGPPDKESTVPCPPKLLPKAKKGTAVYQNDSNECRIAGGKQVRCPPTIVLPEPQATATVRFDEMMMTCVTVEHIDCPAGASCNPPPPQPVACPDELLPHLAPKVKPTKRKGKACYLGATKVVCPK